MPRRISKREIMLDAQATAVSAGIDVTEFRNCVLSILGSSTADLKVFVMGAIKKRDTDTPSNINFADANPITRDSNTNYWDYVEIVDLQDGTAIDGDTGVSLSGNRQRLIEVNVNSLDWLAVRITAVVAGTASVIGAFTTNE